MNRARGIARCGLACCLCAENTHCRGCDSADCPDADRCLNRRCSREKGLAHCFECGEDCRKGMLQKSKPYGFTQFAKRYGEQALLDALARGERRGVVYHRAGVTGDYDNFDDLDALFRFLLTEEVP